MDTTSHRMQHGSRLARALSATTLALAMAPALATDTLEPGDWRWHPAAAPGGPMVAVVSLPEQRIHVYRNGVRIGLSTVSTGKPGHETPTGTFSILQKKRMHRSNLYDDAPMPFMQRLTWDGIALHAGRVAGEPASHGCVRLPREFAEKLYEATDKGMTVVIADYASHEAAVVTPDERAPVDPYTGAPVRRGLRGFFERVFAGEPGAEASGGRTLQAP
jgi:hypothetical protein